MDEVVLLVGNPNAGKSVLFNRLTGGHARVGNWHGVTVDALEGRMEGAIVVDLPGMYRADGGTMEEKVSAAYIESHPTAAILFVSECATLARTASLFPLSKGRRCMLVLTKRKAFERAGGRVDAAGLSARLGIKVIFAEDLKKEHIPMLLASAPKIALTSDMGGLYAPIRDHLSRFDGLLYRAAFGVPFFAALFAFAFFLTFAKGMPGDLMKDFVESLFARISGIAPSGTVVGSLLAGVLTSVGSVLAFLPQIALLELFFILLEESGLFSRLAFLTDGLLSRIGLSGRAVFSLCMGFGCSAAAIFTTRGLEDRDVQRRVILCLPYFPCSAKLPVFLALTSSFFEDPFPAVLLLYALGIGLAFVLSLFLRGKTSPLVMETAPLQIPRPLFVLKALLFQIKQFIIKVATVILAFFILSWMLSSFDFSFRLCAVESSMLAAICGKLSFLFAPAGMGDWRMTYAALSGLIAKENVAGAIALFYGEFPFSAASAFAFAVFMLTCSPCVSAIAASAREVGRGRALLYAAAQTLSALLLCYAVYFLFTGSRFLLLVVPVAIFLCCHEKIYRLFRNRLKNLHRRRLSAGVRLPSRPLKAARCARKRDQDGRQLPASSSR